MPADRVLRRGCEEADRVALSVLPHQCERYALTPASIESPLTVRADMVARFQTIESGLVISILLSFTTQLVSSTPAGRPIALSRQSSRASDNGGADTDSAGSSSVSTLPDIDPDETRALLGVHEERQGKNGRELILGEQGLRLKRQMDVQVSAVPVKREVPRPRVTVADCQFTVRSGSASSPDLPSA